MVRNWFSWTSNTNFQLIKLGNRNLTTAYLYYPHISIEKVTELQKKRAAKMPCQDVAVYCVSCIKSMTIGGKAPHHMVDLVLNEETELQETRIDVYHNALNQYIDEH